MQLFDSWAHVLNPHQFAEFSLPYAQRVIDGVKAKRPGTPLIFHANGGTPSPFSAVIACLSRIMAVKSAGDVFSCLHQGPMAVDLCLRMAPQDCQGVLSRGQWSVLITRGGPSIRCMR